MSSISGLGSITPMTSMTSLGQLGGTSPTSTDAPEAGGFGKLLGEALGQVGELEGNAQFKIEELVTGGDVTQAEVFADVKKFDLAMRTMVQMRNKLLEAYREIQQLRM